MQLEFKGEALRHSPRAIGLVWVGRPLYYFGSVDGYPHYPLWLGGALSSPYHFSRWWLWLSPWWAQSLPSPFPLTGPLRTLRFQMLQKEKESVREASQGGESNDDWEGRSGRRLRSMKVSGVKDRKKGLKDTHCLVDSLEDGEFLDHET